MLSCRPPLTQRHPTIAQLQTPSTKRQPMMVQLQTPSTKRQATITQLQTPSTKRQPMITQLQTLSTKRQATTAQLQTPPTKRQATIAQLQTPPTKRQPTPPQLQTPSTQRQPTFTQTELPFELSEAYPSCTAPLSPSLFSLNSQEDDSFCPADATLDQLENEKLSSNSEHEEQSNISVVKLPSKQSPTIQSPRCQLTSGPTSYDQSKFDQQLDQLIHQPFDKELFDEVWDLHLKHPLDKELVDKVLGLNSPVSIPRPSKKHDSVQHSRKPKPMVDSTQLIPSRKMTFPTPYNRKR